MEEWLEMTQVVDFLVLSMNFDSSNVLISVIWGRPNNIGLALGLWF